MSAFPRTEAHVNKNNSDWLLRGNIRRMTVMVPVRDRVRLATDVYIPAARRASGPTIVKRTPYDRRNVDNLRLASALAASGYNVVLQDTRGRGDSEGSFQHYIATPHEGEDGYDLLEWICAQDWSDGTVGTTGFSYTGSNQQALAIMQHPALKSQVILDAGINYFKSTVREKGAFVPGQLATYALRMALTSPEARRDPLVRARLEQAARNAPQWFSRLPWRKGDTPVSALPGYEDWLLFAQNTPGEDERWRNPQMNIEAHIEKYPDIPVLMVSSWYGHHVWSTFRKLEYFSRHASPKRVIIGTWIHADPYGEMPFSGDVSFGPAASLNMTEIQKRWFDATLRGIDREELEASPRIAYFVMGGGSGRRDASGRLEHGGAWRFAAAWPPGGGQDLKLFLAASGSLEHGNGPARSERRTISIDHEAPVPTVGSSIRNPDIMPGFLSSGACNQVERHDVHRSPGTGLPLSSRHDVAVFRTEPFGKPVEMTGPVFVTLWITASAPACDLSVKIVDEYPPSADWPDGFAMNIAEHYQRFASWTSELPADDGQPRRVEIGPLHLSNVFGVGHRLRLQIANTNWPRFDINPEAPRYVKFSIWCGGETPSCISGTGVLRSPAGSSNADQEGA